MVPDSCFTPTSHQESRLACPSRESVNLLEHSYASWNSLHGACHAGAFIGAVIQDHARGICCRPVSKCRTTSSPTMLIALGGILRNKHGNSEQTSDVT